MPDLERYPTLVTFEELPKELRWDACLAALKFDYTLPFRRACRILMCSRDWVSKYIKPNCHYIYLKSRFGVGGVDYLGIAQRRLDFEEKDSVWFNEEEFQNLIMSSITSCTRQTISIPIEFLIKPDHVEWFRSEYAEAQNSKKSKWEKMEAAVKRHASDLGLTILRNAASPYTRKNSPAVPVPVPVFELERMMAVHDMKNYGDTDEMIYRDLFQRGVIRLEISIPDKDGCISKKIYYLDPEDNIKYDNTVQNVLINYADYILYKDKLTKWESGNIQ